MSEIEKVSVILPLYNGENFLKDTIRSVLQQDFKDLILYIIDDFSSDDGPKIAQDIALKDTHVKYFKMEKRGGCPAATKNFGIKHARGEYIAFIDQDDWWDKTKLSKQVEYLQNNKHINLLGCNASVISDKNGKKLCDYWRDPNKLSDINIREYALEAPLFATSSCIIGRSKFLKENLFDEQYKGADEYDLTLRAVLQNSHQVSMIPQVLCFWRWYSASLSHSDSSIFNAAQDEEIFYKKFIEFDLTEKEREILTNRLWIVRKRKANSLLISRQRTEAIKIYMDYLKIFSGDKTVKIIIFIDSIWPAFARFLVNQKKDFSFNRPNFR